MLIFEEGIMLFLVYNSKRIKWTFTWVLKERLMRIHRRFVPSLENLWTWAVFWKWKWYVKINRSQKWRDCLFEFTRRIVQKFQNCARTDNLETLAKHEQEIVEWFVSGEGRGNTDEKAHGHRDWRWAQTICQAGRRGKIPRKEKEERFSDR